MIPFLIKLATEYVAYTHNYNNKIKNKGKPCYIIQIETLCHVRYILQCL